MSMDKMEVLCKCLSFATCIHISNSSLIPNPIYFLFIVFYRRKSFMTRLFSSKSNTMPVNVPSPKSTVPVDSLSSIDLGIESTKHSDSMSTKSATSSKPDDVNDLSRLIDAHDHDDDDDNDKDLNHILNQSADYDFLNNW